MIKQIINFVNKCYYKLCLIILENEMNDGYHSKKEYKLIKEYFTKKMNNE